MARIIKTEQQKQKSKIKKVLTVLLVVILIAGGIVVVWNFVFKKDNKEAQSVKELAKLEEYGYTLTDLDSKYFKSEFEALEIILEAESVDEKEYVTQVAKMFVIDLYSLNTKVNKYDIGGGEYYHSTKRAMYEQKVMDTLYSTLLDNTFGDRKQELPEVKSVEVKNVEEDTYEIDKAKHDSYVVELEIAYVKSMGYDEKVTVTLIKEDNSNRWSVVDIVPTKAKNEKK